MVYRFANCELDERLYQLRRDGVPVALEPKVFDVLAYLVQHRDRVVSKDELLDKLWPGQVVGENALTRCIRAARAAVGDDGTKQAIIETQRGRGYRFIGEVVSHQKEAARSEQLAGSSQKEEAHQTTGNGSLGSHRESLVSEDQPVSLLDSRLNDFQLNGSQRLTLDGAAPVRMWRRHPLLLVGLLLLTGVIVVGTVIVAQYPSLLNAMRQPLAPITQPVLPVPLPDKPSIAVLPFTNLSGDPEQEYFSDGFTEDLITDLSKLSNLFVISRHSVFIYKDRAVKTQDVSKELGVRYVLEGSARKLDDRIFITTHLVDAVTDGQVWAERYERELKDIFTL